MTDYFTADLHLGHENIIGYVGRPFSNAKEMDAVIRKNFAAILTDADTLYVLGDVATWYNYDIGQMEKVLRKIPGRKILILGNHDHWTPQDYVERGFESVHTYLYHERLGVHLTHDPAVATGPGIMLWLCGHVHMVFKEVRNVLNVGVDVWDFKPVHEDAIREWIKTKRSVID